MNFWYGEELTFSVQTATSANVISSTVISQLKISRADRRLKKKYRLVYYRPRSVGLEAARGSVNNASLSNIAGDALLVTMQNIMTRVAK